MALPAPSLASLRPSAHFTARRSWLNDPNGLVFHNGVYHLFFQTNPSGTTWGNISWGHATSTDLVTWTEHDIAIERTDNEMVFSGSAVVDRHNTAGFAGPGETALVAIYTSARTTVDDGAGRQSQALAYSLDDGATWQRYAGNPVLDIGMDDFRDPKVFRYGGRDGHWVMVVVEAVARRVAIFTSPDLISWTRASDFGPAHATGGVWECPDLFPLTVEDGDEARWVLVVSMNPGGIAGGSGTQYFIGDFDGTTFTPETLSASQDLEAFDWLDYGRDYYAAVSFNDAPGDRRLMIGWASNWDYANETPTNGWRSCMSLVREVTLARVKGRLRLRQVPVLPSIDTSAPTSHRLSVPFTGSDEHTVTLSSDAGDELVITLDGARRTITCDRTRSGETDFSPGFASVEHAPVFAADNTIDLQIIVDTSVVEIFADHGLVSIVEQVFPRAPLDNIDIS